jgi:RNA polymerase sigma-70 factor (ECF subfamily)
VTLCEPGTVRRMPPLGRAAPVPSRPALDGESAAWLAALGAEGREREGAVARLHDLLLRAARFEILRRRSALGQAQARGEELDDLAVQAANDALMAVLAKLDQYRGESRFTTWAYKFALLEASVKVRRRAWRDREVDLAPEAWALLPDRAVAPHGAAESNELVGGVREAIAERLTAHQRDVLVALALNDVPIDVLAERLGTTRGALYKTLHDARRKLRAELAQRGFAIEPQRSRDGGD